MSQSLFPSPAQVDQTHPPRVWTFARLVGFTAISLFVATEILALAGAAVWAVSGLAKFGSVGTGVVVAVFAVPSLLAVAKCVHLAFLAETDPVND